MTSQKKPPIDFTGRRLQIENRRRVVTQLRLRGFTYREIHAGLIELRETDKIKNKPWSIGTIHNDVKVIESRWEKESIENINMHKNKVLAELDEVSRHAWQEKDTKNVLEAIKQKRAVIGVDAAKQSLVGNVGGESFQVQQQQPPSILDGIDLEKLSPEQLDTLERAVTDLDGLRDNQGGESETEPS